MRSMRTMIAAGVTLLALGGLTAVALSAGSAETAITSVPTTDVRTQVVEEVVHRTRRARGSSSAGAAASSGRRAAAAASPASGANRGPGSTTSGPGSANRAADDHGRNRGSDDHGRDRGRGRGGDDDRHSEDHD